MSSLAYSSNVLELRGGMALIILMNRIHAYLERKLFSSRQFGGRLEKMAAILDFQVAGRVDFISVPITVPDLVLVSCNLHNSATKLMLSAPLL